MVEAFYDAKTAATWKPLYRLAELNRLQQNFAYPDQRELHRMYVAVAVVALEATGDDEIRTTTTTKTTTATTIAGFCDVDCRPCRTTTSPILPRPYLSDVAVRSKFRRLGLARALVGAAEEFVSERRRRKQQQQQQRGQEGVPRVLSLPPVFREQAPGVDGSIDFDDYGSSSTNTMGVERPTWLWIRVHESNEAATAMYLSMNYTVVSKDADKSDWKNPDQMVWTLRKELVPPPPPSLDSPPAPSTMTVLSSQATLPEDATTTTECTIPLVTDRNGGTCTTDETGSDNFYII